MKRGTFKQKSYDDKIASLKERQARARKLPPKPKKRSEAKNKRKKAPSVRLLKDKLWKEVKRITRDRFPASCYTCGAYVEGKNDHAGHGKPMGALPLRFKYDIRNIRRQCMVCNVHRGGMQDIFLAKLEQEPEGLMFLQEACYFDYDANAWRIRQDTPNIAGKDATIFVQNLLEQYRSYRTK